ncbi:transmembrane protein 115 [Biomphalaria glabrata]|uniref:Transmembrane protein 115-like n=1 Tax=Biomphalaria glabrata TaxID=6526 RepID=A0A2C9K5X1_BIOGL|nr:transmembrane protein 115-like [Biomphalaria glabrata]KAI8728631.1 transmembrane protein 115-like [Biomphalaria glabrata]KAI8781956.1 transmembrane protein 115 [Biomphalaria glabrata]
MSTSTSLSKIGLSKSATSVIPPLPILHNHFTAAVGKSSIVVKAVAVVVVIGYLFSFISSAIPYITITPGYVMPPNFRVYSFILYCFVELHFWHVLADVAVIVLFGKLLEPLWGARDMLIFFVITNLGVGITTAFLYFFIYLVTLNEEYLFEVNIYGLSGYIAGFCVAVKQVMPDHCLATLPFGKLRNTHIPLTLLILIILLRIAGLLPGPYPYMFLNGMIVSWIYLRFYQKHTNGNRGDMADNFSFASFFPSQFQPLIAIISNSIFSALVKVKLCKKPQRRYDVSSPTTITVTLPGTEPHDAERRKQLALKALNERLSKPDTTPSWPSLDDEGPTSPTAPLLPSSQNLASHVQAALKLPDADSAKLTKSSALEHV